MTSDEKRGPFDRILKATSSDEPGQRDRAPIFIVGTIIGLASAPADPRAAADLDPQRRRWWRFEHPQWPRPRGYIYVDRAKRDSQAARRTHRRERALRPGRAGEPARRISRHRAAEGEAERPAQPRALLVRRRQVAAPRRCTAGVRRCRRPRRSRRAAWQRRRAAAEQGRAAGGRIAAGRHQPRQTGRGLDHDAASHRVCPGRYGRDRRPAARRAARRVQGRAVRRRTGLQTSSTRSCDRPTSPPSTSHPSPTP